MPALWDWVKELKSDRYEWVELSHEVGPDTPHWSGLPDMSRSVAFEYDEGEYEIVIHQYSIASQYGTHVDAPYHFKKAGRKLNDIDCRNMLLPLCVIDASAKAAENPDYALTAEDVQAWEKAHGEIPAGSFVAMRTDWYKRDARDFENVDAAGNAHHPGWTKEALEWVLVKRGAAAVGHEPSDTSPPAAGVGWSLELYVLQQDKFQIEVLRNLDKLPPTGALLFASWPRIRDCVGFSARCVAVYDTKPE